MDLKGYRGGLTAEKSFRFYMPGLPPDDGCWLWAGPAAHQDGYGTFFAGGRTSGRRHYAHRVSFELFVGPIPVGHVIRHRCDTPLCVQPAHLLLGTHADNVADKVSRGRQPRGERHGMATLSDAAVAQIRARYLRGGVTQQGLADEYGTRQSHVSAIVLNKVRRGMV